MAAQSHLSVKTNHFASGAGEGGDLVAGTDHKVWSQSSIVPPYIHDLGWIA